MIEVQAGPCGILSLHGEATIHHAKELHSQLIGFLAQGDQLTAIDFSQLTALDSAGAQILIAFKRAAPEISIHSCPEKIRRFAERTGIEALLF